MNLITYTTIGESGETTGDIVQVYVDTGGKWRWVRKARNHVKVASSGESFASRSNAVRAAKRANADMAPSPMSPEEHAGQVNGEINP